MSIKFDVCLLYYTCRQKFWHLSSFLDISLQNPLWMILGRYVGCKRMLHIVRTLPFQFQLAHVKDISQRTVSKQQICRLLVSFSRLSSVMNRSVMLSNLVAFNVLRNKRISFDGGVASAGSNDSRFCVQQSCSVCIGEFWDVRKTILHIKPLFSCDERVYSLCALITPQMNIAFSMTS